MSLDFGNSNLGQFFTPYNLCEAMAGVTFDDEVKSTIKTKGYITVNEPTCGAGANIIAFANEMWKQGFNYQELALFIAQDLSSLVAMMCYIQMSFLGMAGLVVVGNTLTKPFTTSNYDYKTSHSVWITPMFYIKFWELKINEKRIRGDADA